MVVVVVAPSLPPPLLLLLLQVWLAQFWKVSRLGLAL